MSVYLNRKQASEYIQAKGLPCAKKTLERLASVGGGPNYQRFGGRVVYTTEDLESWIEKKLTSPR